MQRKFFLSQFLITIGVLNTSKMRQLGAMTSNSRRATSCFWAQLVAVKPTWLKLSHGCSMFLLPSPMRLHLLRLVMSVKTLRTFFSNFCKQQTLTLKKQNQASFISTRSTRLLVRVKTRQLLVMCLVKACSKHCSRFLKVRSRRFRHRVDANIRIKSSFKLIQRTFSLSAAALLPDSTK